MEMQVDWESAGDACNSRGDYSGESSCISDWIGEKASQLLKVEEDDVPVFCPASNPNAFSDKVVLSPDSYSTREEISSRASLKISAYCQRWDATTPGVYVPSGSRYNFHYEGKSLEFQTFEHCKHSPRGEEEEEENFIILVDTFDDENLPPQIGKPLLHHCKKCEKSFQDLSSLEEHKQLHEVRNSYQCSLCGKEFLRAANLRIHKLSHSAERSHKCPICNKGFIRPADVWRHLRSFHKVERSSVLRNAIIGNHWSGTQQNQDDSRKSGQLGSVVRKRGKDGSKFYFCPICNKGFSNSSLLSKHKVIHREEKPFKCKECGMAFVQLVRLKRHHQTHTGERPFSCKDCGNTFTRLGSLKRHQRIHTGEKPYSCSYCGLSFTDLGILRRHEQTHVVIQA
ncbi:zinc finger protein 226-like [Sceloporus undulatus]|uniref:zinc finger protein 226-like n=1 Tax=Sceloporus undulatus TaxID=8520 RepID=UPI001C4B938D|nr:zinc finger protein 226-like [Sceloporus undulatus]